VAKGRFVAASSRRFSRFNNCASNQCGLNQLGRAATADRRDCSIPAASLRTAVEVVRSLYQALNGSSAVLSGPHSREAVLREGLHAGTGIADGLRRLQRRAGIPEVSNRWPGSRHRSYWANDTAAWPTWAAVEVLPCASQVVVGYGEAYSDQEKDRRGQANRY